MAITKFLQSGALAFAVGALALTGAAAPASGAELDTDYPEVHQGATTVGEQDAAESYWTSNRMENAVPMDDLVQLQGVPSADGVERGLPTIIDSKAFPSGGEQWTGGGDVVQTTGRIFFTFDGQDSACSGSAVVSDNKSVVLTAGHCVKYQGSWHEDWVFVPGYDNGETPYGTWTASETLTTPQWESGEDINYDVGVGVVNQLNGESLTDVVGAQAVAFNIDYNADMYAFGYPAEDPYDGETLTYCSGATIQDPLMSTDHGLACDMTGGSSGGPWFSEFDESTGTGMVSSVNSFGYVFLPGYMFGPYFGAEAQNLYNSAQSM